MDDLRATLQRALGGSYTLERELGGGGMSRTYVARDSSLNRPVVVKVLAPELLAGLSVERFRREVLLAAALQHPHVVPVLSAGEADGIPWFTMPYVEGDSLRRRLDRGTMSATEAVNILRDVARALAYAHGRGIFHRDIKPDNVLLSAGSATVTDFGIAKALNAARTAGEAGNETLTQVGTAIGTPTYMAPEQALGDPDTNHRADIYAFGVMAYEMLAGRPPFQGSNSSKVLAAHLGETAFPLLQLAPDTPPALAELVMQCLAKDPDQRPQDASQLVRVLETVTTSGSGAAIPSALRGAPLPLGKAILLWLVATATVVVTAWAATRVVGLPDWALPGAIGVMLAGLPVIAATAYVQRTTRRAFSRTPGSPTPTHGTMATLALKASPHLSWKRAWTGGAIAVGGFAVLVIGFMVLRAIGIGPMGSLKARGVFGDHEMLVVADFRAPASDSMLGMTVAEALRTDLAQSRALDVMTRAALRDQLVMMRRSGESRIPYDVAREIAQRAGAKAVLDGEVTQLGQGYVLSASLVGTLDGQQLATFRETVSDENGLINAIGKLGKAVRERAGESLRTIQATRELERVTTSSLPALRKYVEGNRVASEDAQEEQGLRLIQEAVQIDSTFAMAWRKIAVLMGNLGLPREQQLTAITKAFQFRHNLTDDERYLTEGSYYTSGPEPDLQKGLAAYDQAILLDSANGAALNNSAMILQEQARWDEAERRARLATRVPRAFSAAFINLLVSQLHGRSSSESLDSTIALMQERLPGSAYKVWLAGMAEWGKSDVRSAWHMFRMAYDSASNTHVRSNTARSLEGLAAMQGKFRERWNWAGRGDEAAARLRSPAVVRLGRMIDSAFSTLMVVGDTQGAHAILAAALRSVPPASLPVAERPWQAIAGMAARTGDAALVREAQAAWEREQSRSDPLSASIRQGFLVDLAIAEQRWADARQRSAEWSRLAGYPEQWGIATDAFLAERLGDTDGAIASWERFRNSRGLELTLDGTIRPVALIRLGEAYEAAGDTARAIERYGEFVTLWQDADPEQQAKVREIRDRIARLNAARG